MTGRLRPAFGVGILEGMMQTRPPRGTLRTVRFWYRWFPPAA